MEDIEKQETQTVGSQEEKATVEVQDPVIELKAEIERNKVEDERKEAVIKQLQGITKDLQKRGVPKEEIDALNKRLGGMEYAQADLKDILIKHYGEDEDSISSRKTERQKLDERNATDAKPEPNLPPDPEAQRFFNYMYSQGKTLEDPLVKEALAEDRSAQEAFEYLKGKIDEQNEGVVSKQIADGVRMGVEQKLKEMGVTVSGVESPSAAGVDSDDEFLRKYSTGEENDHVRADKILHKMK